MPRHFVPTIGRVILYHFPRTETQAEYRAGEPCPALVCAVNDDQTINIGGFDRGGRPFSRVNVALIQVDDPKPGDGNFAEWMPYQVKVMEEQANKDYVANLDNNLTPEERARRAEEQRKLEETTKNL